MRTLKLIIYKIKSHSKATQVIFLGLFVVLLAAIIMGILLIINSNMRVSGFIIDGECPYSADELAEYAGISISDKFGSVNYKTSEQKILSSAFYVKNVKISRNNLTKIKFVIIEDKAVYYSKISGEYYLMAEDFRILECVAGKLEIEGKSLIGIKFPTLNSAIVGTYPEYSDQYQTYDYMKNTIKAVNASQFNGRINAYDFSEKFNIKLISDNLFIIKLGNSENLEKKLTITNQILTQDKIVEGTPAEVNTSNPEEVILNNDYDHILVLNFD